MKNSSDGGINSKYIADGPNALGDYLTFSMSAREYSCFAIYISDVLAICFLCHDNGQLISEIFNFYSPYLQLLGQY